VTLLLEPSMRKGQSASGFCEERGRKESTNLSLIAACISPSGTRGRPVRTDKLARTDGDIVGSSLDTEGYG
jgi:hypothetical protein